MKLTEKQFKESIRSAITVYTRSTVKRWKRAYYLKERGESPLQYFIRLSSYRIP